MEVADSEDVAGGDETVSGGGVEQSDGEKVVAVRGWGRRWGWSMFGSVVLLLVVNLSVFSFSFFFGVLVDNSVTGFFSFDFFYLFCSILFVVSDHMFCGVSICRVVGEVVS